MEESNNSNEIVTLERRISKLSDKIDSLKNERYTLIKLKEKLELEQIIKIKPSTSKTDWSSEKFDWSKSINDKLKSVFNLQNYRHQQLVVINAFMSNRDIIFVAPTGGGKSLCYQLPAIAKNDLTLVISPLLSLMKDQVWSLKKLGIAAEMLSASSPKEETSQILKKISDGSSNLKLIYITPERMAKSKRFMNALQKCYDIKRLGRIAIDEVHCCSQWGHDYRPDYKYLGTIKQLFPDIPILGVTATATSKVVMEIREMLSIKDCEIIRAPFNRPNLYYHVLEKPSEKESVYELLGSMLTTRFKDKSGIIYTFSINDSEDISKALLYRGCKVRPYHAKLDEKHRNKTHALWQNGEIQAVVATVAFGMGIDKADVRFVIHHTMSKSIENFYQESGRAGRDGNKSECILLYRFADFFKISTMVFSEYNGIKNAYSMLDYCVNGTKCRRELISVHFAEVWNKEDCNNMCDKCFYHDKAKPSLKDISNYYLQILKIIKHAEQQEVRLTASKLIDSWFLKGPSNLRIKNMDIPKIDRYYAEQIIANFLILGYLREDFHYTAYATISYIKKGNLNKTEPIMFQNARVFKLPENYSSLEVEITTPKKRVSEVKVNSSSKKLKLNRSIDKINDEIIRIVKEVQEENQNEVILVSPAKEIIVID